MKKVLLMALVATVGFFSSCGEDDEASVTIAGEFIIDDEATTLVNGYYIDANSSNLARTDIKVIGPTYYEYTLWLTDGTIELDSSGDPVLTNGEINCIDCNFEVMMDFYSTTEDVAGTYDVQNYCDGGSGDYVYITAYSNDDPQTIDLAGKSGTVSVTGTELDYSVTFSTKLYDFNNFTQVVIDKRVDGNSCSYVEASGTGDFEKTFIELDESTLGK